MMKYEKPQKGNPHQIVIKQHIFPTESIKRFVDSSGFVEVYMLEHEKIVSLKPEDIIFCARRAWDQRAEQSYMKDVEDQFQELVSTPEKNKTSFSDDDNKVISDFYALWNIRFCFQDQTQDFKIDGEPSVNFTKDEEELLESNHISYFKPGGIFPGRQMAGLRMQLNLFEARKKLKDIKWTLIEAEEGEFIVPDNFSSDLIVPLNPSSCFLGFNSNKLITDRTIRKESVERLNKKAIQLSRRYYFARCFRNCIGLNNH